MKQFLACLILVAMLVQASAQNTNYQKEYNNGYRGGEIKGLTTLDNSLGFCVIGDWGRYGGYFQKPVAAILSDAVVSADASFILSTGDNIYPGGVASEYDPAWKSCYEDIYDSYPTHVDWYVSLGNHDYKTNPDAEVAYTKISARWHMPARYFSFKKRLPGKDTTLTAEFFVIDSSPFQKDYYKDEDYGPKVALTDTAAQRKWLEDALQKSTATWKFVVGHHPLYTAGGRHGKTQDMQQVFKPIFEKYKVDAYICGHEHILEYDAPKDVHFVQFISGTGCEATAIKDASEASFAMQQYGVLTANITSKEALFQFVSYEGKVLYTTTLKK